MINQTIKISKSKRTTLKNKKQNMFKDNNKPKLTVKTVKKGCDKNIISSIQKKLEKREKKINQNESIELENKVDQNSIKSINNEKNITKRTYRKRKKSNITSKIDSERDINNGREKSHISNAMKPEVFQQIKQQEQINLRNDQLLQKNNKYKMQQLQNEYYMKVHTPFMNNIYKTDSDLKNEYSNNNIYKSNFRYNDYKKTKLSTKPNLFILPEYYFQNEHFLNQDIQRLNLNNNIDYRFKNKCYQQNMFYNQNEIFPYSNIDKSEIINNYYKQIEYSNYIRWLYNKDRYKNSKKYDNSFKQTEFQ